VKNVVSVVKKYVYVHASMIIPRSGKTQEMHNSGNNQSTILPFHARILYGTDMYFV